MHRVRTLAATATLLLPAVSIGQTPPQIYRVPQDLRSSLDVRSAAAQELYLPPASRQPLTVELTFGGARHTVQLRPYEVRTPDFRVYVDDGVRLTEIPAPASVTYRGDLLGEPGSAVAATLIDGQLRAQMRSGGKIWAVQPASDAGPGMPLSTHVVYERGDMEDLPFDCMALEGPPRAPQPQNPEDGTPQIAAASALQIARLAIDADEPFYRDKNSSTTAVQNDITGIINASNVIFTRDVGIEHQISTIVIRTVPVYSASGGSELLAQFRSRWNAQQGNFDRDVAHLFSGRTPPGSTIGIAYVDTICTTAWAYGVSWTTFSNNFSRRVGVTAHELGHGWGAGHCNGVGDCRIMCSGIGGCSGDVTAFGSATILAIESFKSTLDCLSDPEPTVSPSPETITPSSVTSFLPEEVTLTGSDFSQVSSVTVGGAPVSFTVVSADTLRFTPPSPFDIDTHEVLLTNPIGTGSIDLEVTGRHPSALEIPAFVFRDESDPYRVHTQAGWQAILVVSPSALPSIEPGVVDLAIGNGFTSIIIFPLTADTRGVAEIELAFPGTVPPFTNVFWQAVTFDPANLLFPLEVSDWTSMFVL